MTGKRFKNSVIEFNKVKRNFKESGRSFKFDVKEFMERRGIPVSVLFFGTSFGLDIRVDVKNWRDVPRKIPLDVLSDFCDEFGCEFEYTNCDGNRYIFTFNGLEIGY